MTAALMLHDKMKSTWNWAILYQFHYITGTHKLETLKNSQERQLLCEFLI